MLEETEEEEQEEAGQTHLGNYHPSSPPSPKKCSVADSWHLCTDPNPLIRASSLMNSDPAIFVIDLHEANKTLFFSKFFCSLLFEGTITSFFKDKKS